MADQLNVTLSEHVAVVEFDRGPGNFFDRALLAELVDTAQQLASDRACRAIVLCSTGRHFCAGADFGSGAVPDDRARWATELYSEGARLFELELPIVAAVQGTAVGGGLGLACAADFRVGSTASRFHANFATLGFHHGFGLSATLPRIVGPQHAQDLLITARRTDGAEAYRIGLIDRLVDPGHERDGAITLAQEIAAAAPLAVASIKHTQRAGLPDAVRAAMAHELDEQRRLWQTKDSEIGIAASLTRTTPEFVGE